MDNTKIYFAKVKPDAIIPSKRDEDGAYDIYACFDDEHIIIKPQQIVSIPTGIISAFSSDYRIVFQERGSTGIIGLKVNAGLIDSGFRGEWFVLLNNTTDKTIILSKTVEKKDEINGVILYPYVKAICQAKVQDVPKVQVKEVSVDDIMKVDSERGNGALGSSKK